MQYNKLIIAGFAALLVACGGGENNLDSKKQQVTDLKGQIKDIKSQIADLEAEIREEDPSYGKKSVNAVMVTAIDVQPGYFEHKTEMRGGVSSRTNVTVGAQVMGEVLDVRVKEGQKVKRGQTLLVIDDEVLQNNVAELETALDLASILAEKQEKLWKKNIGTEVQYLQAKNNKESLERKLATAKSQLRLSKVRAPFAGSIDAVDVKVGEMAQPGFPLVRIVNPDDVHINVDVSERFIGKFNSGDVVDVYFPTQDKQIKSTIASIGQVINSENRTFEMEIYLPTTNFPVRPNQVVVINAVDYRNEKAITVPTELIQRDSRGTFIYELIDMDGQMTASKVHVKTGISFNQMTEITAGLKPSQKIAYKGHRDLAQGVVVAIQEDTQDMSLVAN